MSSAGDGLCRCGKSHGGGVEGRGARIGCWNAMAENGRAGRHDGTANGPVAGVELITAAATTGDRKGFCELQ